MYPAVKLNQLYSLNLYDGLNIIFENLKMLDFKVLKDIKEKKKLDIIEIVPTVVINMKKQHITIFGYKINNSTYIVNCDGRGDIFTLRYQCSNEDIITAIEYLYQMYKNMFIKSENNNNNNNNNHNQPDEYL